MRKIRIRDGKKLDPGFGIRDKHLNTAFYNDFPYQNAFFDFHGYLDLHDHYE
jgi:hypothetical protein